jgi:hypothetical protein
MEILSMRRVGLPIFRAISQVQHKPKTAGSGRIFGTGPVDGRFNGQMPPRVADATAMPL